MLTVFDLIVGDAMLVLKGGGSAFTQLSANISKSLRGESFQFKPARRVEIPKANGNMRKLAIASPRQNYPRRYALGIRTHS